MGTRFCPFYGFNFVRKALQTSKVVLLSVELVLETNLLLYVYV